MANPVVGISVPGRTPPDSDAYAVFIHPSIRKMKRWEQAQWFLKHWRNIEAEVNSWTSARRVTVAKNGKIVNAIRPKGPIDLRALQ
jgi:hypothetical protein